MQRQLTLQMPLAAGNLGSVKPAADLYLDSLGPETKRFFHRFSHRATKRDPLLELRGNLFCLQLGIQFRFMNLLNRNQDLTPRARRNVALQISISEPFLPMMPWAATCR